MVMVLMFRGCIICILLWEVVIFIVFKVCGFGLSCSFSIIFLLDFISIFVRIKGVYFRKVICSLYCLIGIFGNRNCFWLFVMVFELKLISLIVVLVSGVLVFVFSIFFWMVWVGEDCENSEKVFNSRISK